MKEKKRVLIIVDIQNDFAHPAGALYVKDGEKVALAVEELVKEKRADYDLIIATGDWHPKNHYSFKENGGQWPRHCVKNSWGAGLLLSNWTVRKIDVFIVKGTHPRESNDYSGFSGHALYPPLNLTIEELLYLLRHGEDKENVTIDVVGLALDYCVKATAIDAAKLGYKTRVLLKYTKAVNLNPDDDKKAIEEMKKAGVEIVE